MPGSHSSRENVKDWPVKVYRGTFSDRKKNTLYFRCHRRRIRAVFQPST